MHASLRVSDITTSTDVHRHDYEQLMICLQGCMHFDLPSESSRVIRGSVGLLPMETEHQFIVRGVGCRAIVLDFVADDPLIKALGDVTEAPLCQRLMETPRILEPMDGMEKLLTFYEGLGRFAYVHLPEVRHQVITSLITELLISDCPRAQKELRTARVSAERLKAWVDARLHRSISVAEIADAFHTSESHLYVLIKQVMGCSPAAYVHQRRMRKALALLQETEQSIGCVAGQVGYADAGAFSKAFRREFMKPPSAFR